MDNRSLGKRCVEIANLGAVGRVIDAVDPGFVDAAVVVVVALEVVDDDVFLCAEAPEFTGPGADRLGRRGLSQGDRLAHAGGCRQPRGGGWATTIMPACTSEGKKRVYTHSANPANRPQSAPVRVPPLFLCTDNAAMIGAVAAAGAFLGEKALYTSATIKMIQNVLIGVIAFCVAVFWCAKYECAPGQKVSPMEVWHRFPKFVLGFIAASIIFSSLRTRTDQMKNETMGQRRRIQELRIRATPKPTKTPPA